jgi:hypothetical protein
MSDAPENHDWIRGRVVRPTNRHYASGIHDDATAQAAGFRGGTIAGSAHLDTFVPLALDLWGDKWFERGSVSMAFKYATTDNEPTFVSMQTTSNNGQHAAQVDTETGTLVAIGTLGSPVASAATHLRLSEPPHDASNARILSILSKGDTIGPAMDVISSEQVTERSENGLITEPLQWYEGISPWGTQIVPPSAIIDSVNRVVSAQLLPKLPPAVGMWSALEVQFVNGPVFANREYTINGRIVAINDSPKTEVIWQDFTMSESNETIATVRIQSRFVKSTSALWENRASGLLP